MDTQNQHIAGAGYPRCVRDQAYPTAPCAAHARAGYQDVVTLYGGAPQPTIGALIAVFERSVVVACRQELARLVVFVGQARPFCLALRWPDMIAWNQLALPLIRMPAPVDQLAERA